MSITVPHLPITFSAGLDSSHPSLNISFDFPPSLFINSLSLRPLHTTPLRTLWLGKFYSPVNPNIPLESGTIGVQKHYVRQSFFWIPKEYTDFDLNWLSEGNGGWPVSLQVWFADPRRAVVGPSGRYVIQMWDGLREDRTKTVEFVKRDPVGEEAATE